MAPEGAVQVSPTNPEEGEQPQALNYEIFLRSRTEKEKQCPRKLKCSLDDLFIIQIMQL